MEPALGILFLAVLLVPTLVVLSAPPGGGVWKFLALLCNAIAAVLLVFPAMITADPLVVGLSALFALPFTFLMWLVALILAGVACGAANAAKRTRLLEQQLELLRASSPSPATTAKGNDGVTL